MAPSYNVGGKMKTLNPLQRFATKNLSGNDYTQGVNFSSSVPFNLNKQDSVVTTSLNSPSAEQYDGISVVQRGNRWINTNAFKNPMSFQKPSLANSFNPNMYYKPKGRFDVQIPIGLQ